MPGIYIHIPLCTQKCHYCNFFSLASEKSRDAIADALCKELELQQNYPGSDKIRTIYFGGGTPSLLKTRDIEKILTTIYHLFSVEDNPEITLEANPEDLNARKLAELRKSGINRLSIGIQSFEDEDLRFLNRTHTGRQAKSSIKRSQEAGFTNLSIDLIYGIPTMDSFDWESNLMTALDLRIPHISAYALTVEERTPLAVMIRKGKMPGVNEDEQAQHFFLLMSLLRAHGYEHYEISNFCKPGMYSRHNSAYWTGEKYLGIGPSAHSYDGNTRQWNISNLSAYLQQISSGVLSPEKESLTKAQKFNEFMMTSLRTMWGCDLSKLEEQFGKEFREQTLEDARPFIEQKLISLKDKTLYLTHAGKFRADGIIADFFRIQE
jgi:oxygen-independent coproporphyrinogen-3 oxidase